MLLEVWLNVAWCQVSHRNDKIMLFIFMCQLLCRVKVILWHRAYKVQWDCAATVRNIPGFSFPFKSQKEGGKKAMMYNSDVCPHMNVCSEQTFCCKGIGNPPGSVPYIALLISDHTATINQIGRAMSQCSFMLTARTRWFGKLPRLPFATRRVF